MATSRTFRRTVAMKIVVLGGPYVGKSAATLRFTTKQFIEDIASDGDKLYFSDLVVDGEPLALEIADLCSAGNELFPTPEQLDHMDAALLVYSITDRQSFTYIQRVRETLPLNVSIILVGNKSDLDPIRQVTYQEGDDLSKDYHCTFFELSARNDSWGAESSVSPKGLSMLADVLQRNGFRLF